jgi:hypothetical protein
MSCKKIESLDSCLCGPNKGILIFDRDKASHEFDMACNALSAFSLLHQIDQKCRAYLKYGEGNEDPDEFIQSIRNDIHEDEASNFMF